MLILRSEISKQREQHRTFVLEQDLNQAQSDLTSILKEWQWGTQPFTNATDFLSKMKPWISSQIKAKKELEEFLKKKGVKSLAELNNDNL